MAFLDQLMSITLKPIPWRGLEDLEQMVAGKFPSGHAYERSQYIDTRSMGLTFRLRDNLPPVHAVSPPCSFCGSRESIVKGKCSNCGGPA